MKKDKLTHIFVGMMVAALVGLPTYLDSLNLFAGVWSAAWSGIIAAAVKELCDDNTDGNNWDWHDFGATAIGVAIVVVFIILLHFGRS